MQVQAGSGNQLHLYLKRNTPRRTPLFNLSEQGRQEPILLFVKRYDAAARRIHYVGSFEADPKTLIRVGFACNVANWQGTNFINCSMQAGPDSRIPRCHGGRRILHWRSAAPAACWPGATCRSGESRKFCSP
jgi:hypothetical protein